MSKKNKHSDRSEKDNSTGVVHWFLHSPLGVGLILLVVGGIGWLIRIGYNEWRQTRNANTAREDSKNVADVMAANALSITAAEVSGRRAKAKLHWEAGSPNKALNILNGQDSDAAVISNLQNVPLSKLLMDLQSLGYDWKGVEFARLKALAETSNSGVLPELFSFLDQAFPQQD